MGQRVEGRQHASSEGRVALRFCLAFAAFTVAVFLALYGVQDTIIVHLNRHVGWLAGAILSALGAPVASRGAVVSVGSFAVEIKNNCNAIYEAGLFAAAVWAYPAPVRAKAVGTLIGVSVLYLVNLVRVLSLLAIGVLAPGWFDVAHLYIWQALFFAVVAGCWFGWILRLPSKT
jgi:exosortase/archaeosortase family protein